MLAKRWPLVGCEPSALPGWGYNLDAVIYCNTIVSDVAGNSADATWADHGHPPHRGLTQSSHQNADSACRDIREPCPCAPLCLPRGATRRQAPASIKAPVLLMQARTFASARLARDEPQSAARAAAAIAGQGGCANSTGHRL